jgi:ABC-type Fe3+ transport system substrate-binding protein
VGVLQAVSQGEVDIGITEAAGAFQAMNKGAPIAFVWPEVVAVNQSVGCLAADSVNNPDLVTLFWAWRMIEGEWLIADLGGGGARPFYAPEADKYPLGKVIRDAGLTAEKNLSQPQTDADWAALDGYRTAAVDALTLGIQTGTLVPYPWACQKNHPACNP